MGCDLRVARKVGLDCAPEGAAAGMGVVDAPVGSNVKPPASAAAAAAACARVRTPTEVVPAVGVDVVTTGCGCCPEPPGVWNEYEKMLIDMCYQAVRKCLTVFTS